MQSVRIFTSTADGSMKMPRRMKAWIPHEDKGELLVDDNKETCLRSTPRRRKHTTEDSPHFKPPPRAPNNENELNTLYTSGLNMQEGPEQDESLKQHRGHITAIPRRRSRSISSKGGFPPTYSTSNVRPDVSTANV